MGFFILQAKVFYGISCCVTHFICSSYVEQTN